jgi:hypothetical protein
MGDTLAVGGTQTHVKRGSLSRTKRGVNKGVWSLIRTQVNHTSQKTKSKSRANQARITGHVNSTIHSYLWLPYNLYKKDDRIDVI